MLSVMLVALMLITVVPSVSFAHCPLCLVATGSAVAIAKSIGVNDLVFGTLSGAFTVSMALWFARTLQKKDKFKAMKYLSHAIIIASVGMTIGTYVVSGTSSDMERLISGIDDLTAGTMVGSILTLAAFTANTEIRKMNNNKSFVPMQAILLALFLLALSVGVYELMGLAR